MTFSGHLCRSDPDNRAIEGDRLIGEHRWRLWQKPAGDEQQSRKYTSDKDQIADYRQRSSLLKIEQFRFTCSLEEGAAVMDTGFTLVRNATKHSTPMANVASLNALLIRVDPVGVALAFSVVGVARCFIQNESCRVEPEQLLKCTQYVFSLPVAIERSCGINANHAENRQLTGSDPTTRAAIARNGMIPARFNKRSTQAIPKRDNQSGICNCRASTSSTRRRASSNRSRSVRSRRRLY
jgi:hypothetical protein